MYFEKYLEVASFVVMPSIAHLDISQWEEVVAMVKQLRISGLHGYHVFRDWHQYKFPMHLFTKNVTS